MAIKDRLSGIDDHAKRAAVKAQGLADAFGSSYSWTRGKFSATVTGIFASGETLRCHLIVTQDGKVVFKDDIVIVNPPLMVNTGSSHAPIFTESPKGIIVAIMRDILSPKGIDL